MVDVVASVVTATIVLGLNESDMVVFGNQVDMRGAMAKVDAAVEAIEARSLEVERVDVITPHGSLEGVAFPLPN